MKLYCKIGKIKVELPQEFPFTIFIRDAVSSRIKYISLEHLTLAYSGYLTTLEEWRFDQKLRRAKDHMREYKNR